MRKVRLIRGGNAFRLLVKTHSPVNEKLETQRKCSFQAKILDFRTLEPVSKQDVCING